MTFCLKETIYGKPLLPTYFQNSLYGEIFLKSLVLLNLNFEKDFT